MLVSPLARNDRKTDAGRMVAEVLQECDTAEFRALLESAKPQPYACAVGAVGYDDSEVNEVDVL